MSTVAESPASLAIRGIVTLLFGIIAVTMPLSAFWALVFVFGAYALVDGISALTSAVMRPRRNGYGWLVVEGIARQRRSDDCAVFESSTLGALT